MCRLSAARSRRTHAKNSAIHAEGVIREGEISTGKGSGGIRATLRIREKRDPETGRFPRRGRVTCISARLCSDSARVDCCELRAPVALLWYTSAHELGVSHIIREPAHCARRIYESGHGLIAGLT